MNTELAAFTKKQDPDVLDHMMKKLALNSYGQLDFQEFLILGYRVPWVLPQSFPEAYLTLPFPF